jgi:hypothetical protein
MKSIARIVRTTVVAVSAIYSFVLYRSDLQLDTAAKKILVFLPMAASLLVVAYEKWLWKLPFVLKTHTRPLLSGLWKVTIQPDPDSKIPRDGNRGPIEGYIVIEQTLWTISIRQYTVESESNSLASTFFRRFDSRQQTLSFTYDNEPKRRHQKRSPRSIGACELYVTQGAPSKVNGRYYTDRFTAGELFMALVDRSVNHIDFESAKTYAATKIIPSFS